MVHEPIETTLVPRTGDERHLDPPGVVEVTFVASRPFEPTSHPAAVDVRRRTTTAKTRHSPTLHGMSRSIPAVLSIAGSDSGGGAGIQADLKAFARCGVHGMTAITALTAQNTTGVSAVHTTPPAMIVEQVRQVATDIGVDAVKIGMLGTAETVKAVTEALGLLEPGTPIVIDPVMVAESGAVLLDDAARAALVEQLLPLATVITPNLPEARVLAESDPDPEAEVEAEVETLARSLHRLGPTAVVVTGGHRDEVVDVFFDGDTLERLSGPRHPDGAAHGSGCTHSSALAAHLALGHTPLEAARAARTIASEAVRDGLRELGAGPGPVDVFGLRQRAGLGAPEPRRTAAPLA
jgi:hydroxymethylpyrimidine/phosphomethylpyrimidine kinase